MTQIKITEQNAAKIETALAAINGRAASFTITHFAEVAAFVANAEKQLATLTKKAQVGAAAFCRPAGPTANSYKFGAKSTGIRIERRASGWFLVNVTEEKVWPKTPELCSVKITRAQADEIKRRSVAAFQIVEVDGSMLEAAA